MELSLERPPKQPGLAAQLPHVTPSKGRSARMPTSAKAGTAEPLLRGHRCRPRRDPSNFSFCDTLNGVVLRWDFLPRVS